MSDNNSTGNQKPTLSWSQPAAAKPVTEAAKPAASAVAATPVKAASAAAAKNGSSAGVYIGIFAAGLIIGALIGWAMTPGKSDEYPAASVAPTGTTTTAQPASGTSAAVSNTTTGSSLILASKQPAGFAVAVDKVEVVQPTWLVVYEDHNGTPGNAIGAGLFFAGQTNGTIQLLRATLPGQSYFVGRSLDDGDKVFSLQNDMPVRDAQGNPLFTSFTAQ